MPALKQICRWRWRIALCVAIALAGLVLAEGANRTPTPSAEGTAFAGSARPAADSRIKIATFNIHSGIGSDGRFDLERTARLLEEFDFIGLNEVRGPSPVGGSSQAEHLGRRLQLAWLFAPTEHQWFRDHFGNGVLSAIPVTHWTRIPLEGTAGRGRRNLVTVRLQTADGEMSVLVTHLDRTTDRRAQLQTVVDAFLNTAPPAVLMGDFNTPLDDPILRTLLETPGVIDCVGTGGAKSLPLATNAARIDWIFARGVKCLDAGIVETDASDHPLAWAELQFAPARPR